ncbi:peptide chain release factor 1 [Cenarchaeum symbiosum A]|uniref:Peptide chain release factor 1 n=1 Tax=Cenarchaeum symbiosum (strain A) TaxID=414004 RepID=A0RY88_CENSY|nr:peptide chain release factor 1 [Cenarchaeum symbiosum A]
MKARTPEVPPREWLAVNQFLHGLKKAGSPCVSIYYRHGKRREAASRLGGLPGAREIAGGMAEALMRPGGAPAPLGGSSRTACVFGWMEGGTVRISAMAVSMRLPHMCVQGRRPYTKPVRDILKTGRRVVLVVLDQQSAWIREFTGGKVTAEERLGTHLQGRHKKGGQSQKRFLRARQGGIRAFLSRVEGKVSEMAGGADLVLIGGPGQAKTGLEGIMRAGVLGRCRIIEGVSKSTPEQEIHRRMIARLYRLRRRRVEGIMRRYEDLVREGLAAHSNGAILAALKRGAVETLIVSAEYHTGPQFRRISAMLELAEGTGARTEFVSAPALISRLEMDGSALAILRYAGGRSRANH